MRGTAIAAILVACSTACATVAPTTRSSPAAATAAPTEGPLAGVQPMAGQIIRRGEVGVTVAQVDDARRHLEHAAMVLGADIAHLEAHERESADYTFRVPPDRLEPLMDSAAALGAVGRRTINTDDVTAQVVDAEGRLTALRATRDQLQQLMNRAGSVQDVITVQRELAMVQQQIESLEGRLNAMRSEVALSELAVHLAQRHELGPVAVFLVGLGRLIGKLFVAT